MTLYTSLNIACKSLSTHFVFLLLGGGGGGKGILCRQLILVYDQYIDDIVYLINMSACKSLQSTNHCSAVLTPQWTVPQIFKLLPMRHIFFDLVIRFITNRKYAFFCIFYVRLSADNIILIYWIKIVHVLLY